MKAYRIMVRDGATCELLASTIQYAPNLATLYHLGKTFREDILRAASAHNYYLLTGGPDDVYWEYEEIKDAKSK